MACRHRRRGRWLLILLVIGAAVAWWLRRQAQTSTPTAAAGEAPFQPFTAAPVVPESNVPEPVMSEPVVSEPVESWVTPVDGAAPEGYPVKVAASGIFHVPGGRFYDRTRAERCYPDAASAVADGYRPSKA